MVMLSDLSFFHNTLCYYITIDRFIRVYSLTTLVYKNMSVDVFDGDILSILAKYLYQSTIMFLKPL